MDGRVFKRSALAMIREGLIPMLFTLFLIGMIALGLRQTELSSREQGYRLLDESIHNAIVRCYVVEGHYPGSIAHVEDHYGVFIDRTRYAVFYEIFSPNLMPDVTVEELR